MADLREPEINVTIRKSNFNGQYYLDIHTSPQGFFEFNSLPSLMYFLHKKFIEHTGNNG